MERIKLANATVLREKDLGKTDYLTLPARMRLRKIYPQYGMFIAEDTLAARAMFDKFGLEKDNWDLRGGDRKVARTITAIIIDQNAPRYSFPSLTPEVVGAGVDARNELD